MIEGPIVVLFFLGFLLISYMALFYFALQSSRKIWKETIDSFQDLDGCPECHALNRYLYFETSLSFGAFRCRKCDLLIELSPPPQPSSEPLSEYKSRLKSHKKALKNLRS